VLYGDVENTDLIKIQIRSGKLTLLRFDDFEGRPLPRLLERVKIKLWELDFDLFEYAGQSHEQIDPKGLTSAGPARFLDAFS